MDSQSTQLLLAGPAFAAAFLASAVEAVEAATLVLAVGLSRGWRSSLSGAAAALLLLAALVALFGTAIAAVPIALLQIVAGTLLLLFGVRWLRKAMLRYAGVVALRDEDNEFERQSGALGVTAARRWDAIGALASFKAVLLEGVEVIVVVLGIGTAGDRLHAASLGAAAACTLVALAAALLRRPLSRVPENFLKVAVGIMVSAFGIYWFGEGTGIDWRFGDATLLALMAILIATAIAGTKLARRVASP